MTFSVFGGIAFVGFLLTLGIRGEKLETDGLDEEADSEEDDDEEEEDNGDAGIRR